MDNIKLSFALAIFLVSIAGGWLPLKKKIALNISSANFETIATGIFRRGIFTYVTRS